MTHPKYGCKVIYLQPIFIWELIVIVLLCVTIYLTENPFTPQLCQLWKVGEIFYTLFLLLQPPWTQIKFHSLNNVPGYRLFFSVELLLGLVDSLILKLVGVFILSFCRKYQVCYYVIFIYKTHRERNVVLLFSLQHYKH